MLGERNSGTGDFKVYRTVIYLEICKSIKVTIGVYTLRDKHKRNIFSILPETSQVESDKERTWRDRYAVRQSY